MQRRSWRLPASLTALLLIAACNGKPGGLEPSTPAPRPDPGFLALASNEGPNEHTAGTWRYVLDVRAKDTLSETRAGLLFKADRPVVGGKVGETITTPWGPMRWFGPPPRPIRIRTPYEFGWLHRGVYDRELD